MLSFDPGLYVSSGLKEKKTQLCESFMQGRIVSDLYVIYRNPNNGKAEFMKSNELKKKFYAQRDITILGLAEDYGKALMYLAFFAAEMAEA